MMLLHTLCLMVCVMPAMPLAAVVGRRLAVAQGAAVVLGVPKSASALPVIGSVPKIPRESRQRLNQDLAVVLMRSSYNATDELDFVAMDKFQKDFFLRRQNKWEDYRNDVKKATGGSSVMQGDLGDPFYFDFISFAQYDTINFELEKPAAAFEELRTAEGETEVVLRSNDLKDSQLPDEHANRVGDAILDFIVDRFKDVDTTSRDLDTNINQLLKWLIVLGFADDLSFIFDGSNLQARFLGPANLWSLQALKGRKLTNDFAAKVLAAYLRRNPNVVSFGTPFSQIKGPASTLFCSKIKLRPPLV